MSPRSDSNRKKKPPSWSNLWLKSTNSLKHVVVSMQLHHPLAAKQTPTPNPRPPPSHFTTTATATTATSFSPQPLEKARLFDHAPCGDRTLLLPDQILHRIFSNLPSSDFDSLYLVCKRWLNLQGRLVRSLRVLDYRFLESGRLISRFPNLTTVDLINAFVSSPQDSSIILSRGGLCFRLDSDFPVEQDHGRTLLPESKFIPDEAIDKGLIALANGYPNLRKLTTFAGTGIGLTSISAECPFLQQLELHGCSDDALHGIVCCKNLQILKLVGSVYGKESSVSDIGLTILAQGCRRLVKLELSSCEGSFDGIKAIAQCCQMLEELSITDHRMEDGWVAAVSQFENLRSLRLISCKRIDTTLGVDEYLGSCRTLEYLQLHKCHLRNKESLRALFAVCQDVKEITIQDCWGLDDDIFSTACTCRGVRSLSLEGTSLLTTKGLESVLLSWVELERLRVISCLRIKENEVSSELSALFALLHEFKWRPDTKSHLSSYMGTSAGKRGSKFFRKSQILKSLANVTDKTHL